MSTGLPSLYMEDTTRRQYVFELQEKLKAFRYIVLHISDYYFKIVHFTVQNLLIQYVLYFIVTKFARRMSLSDS